MNSSSSSDAVAARPIPKATPTATGQEKRQAGIRGWASLEIKRDQKLLQLFEFVGRHWQLKREGNRIQAGYCAAQASKATPDNLLLSNCSGLLSRPCLTSPQCGCLPSLFTDVSVVSCPLFGFGCTRSSMPFFAILPVVPSSVAYSAVYTSRIRHLQLARFARIFPTAVAFPLQSSLTCHANGKCTPMCKHWEKMLFYLFIELSTKSNHYIVAYIGTISLL